MFEITRHDEGFTLLSGERADVVEFTPTVFADTVVAIAGVFPGGDGVEHVVDEGASVGDPFVNASLVEVDALTLELDPLASFGRLARRDGVDDVAGWEAASCFLERPAIAVLLGSDCHLREELVAEDGGGLVVHNPEVEAFADDEVNLAGVVDRNNNIRVGEARVRPDVVCKWHTEAHFNERLAGGAGGDGEGFVGVFVEILLEEIIPVIEIAIVVGRVVSERRHTIGEDFVGLVERAGVGKRRVGLIRVLERLVNGITEHDPHARAGGDSLEDLIAAIGPGTTEEVLDGRVVHVERTVTKRRQREVEVHAYSSRFKAGVDGVKVHAYSSRLRAGVVVVEERFRGPTLTSERSSERRSTVSAALSVGADIRISRRRATWFRSSSGDILSSGLDNRASNGLSGREESIEEFDEFGDSGEVGESMMFDG